VQCSLVKDVWVVCYRGRLLLLWGVLVRAGAHAYLGPRPGVRRAGDMMVVGWFPVG
jgi:hypothetical protein